MPSLLLAGPPPKPALNQTGRHATRRWSTSARPAGDFVKYSARVRDALSLHIQDLLSRGVSVVLDFPGNTRAQRQWFRALFEAAGVEHELHFIDVSNDLCKLQLRQRSEALPAGSPWTTDAEFDAITAFFQAPTEDERFNVIRHKRA